jgi:hypothetical protein
MNVTRDPKGYYIALGIDESADADAIKAAYRTKAKRLHPDFNPSPIAAKQFHRLHEAYETLSDPAKRTAYDRPWRDTAKSNTNGNASGGAYARRSETKREANADKPADKSQERAQDPPQPKSEPCPTTAAASEQPAVCKCGKVTAQPRYIIFDLVWGRLNKVQRRGVSGVFCRSCADRTAVRSSLVTWLAGWWAWPRGPKETVIALANNIRGGRRPPERNARLLMRQARAFKARGEMELARSAAEQAIAFAATPHLRHEVDSLLLSLSSYPARALKDRWAKPGWAATVQVLPLAAVVGLISMSLTLMSSVPLTKRLANLLNRVTISPERVVAPTAVSAPHTNTVPAIATGRVYSVAAKQANLRTGPGSNYQLVSILSQGGVVLVTEADPSGKWLRVATPEGTTGFMDASDLSPDVRLDALEDVGAEKRASQPSPSDATSQTPQP